MSRNKFIFLFVTAIILLGITIYVVVAPNKNTSTQQNGQSATDQGAFPIFGNKNVTPTQNDTNIPNDQGQQGGVTNSTGNTNTETSLLFLISKKPVAGATSIMKETINNDEQKEQSVWFRYVARENGFVYEKGVKDLSFEKKISTTTIPHVEEALFFNNGKSIALRYLGDNLETIKTFLGVLPNEITGGDGPSTLRGSFLPENITEFSKSALGDYYFYLSPFGEDVAGTLVTASTDKKSQFFNSKFHEWATGISNNGSSVFITTKPSSTVPGYSYKLSVPQNNPSKILGGINGLTIQPNQKGDAIIYADNTLLLKGYNLATKKSVPFGIKTLPEKCTWSKDNITVYCLVPNTLVTTQYPDNWYQGTVSFIDGLWKINTNTGATTFIENISGKNKGAFDGIQPSLSVDESVLFFINKNNYELWGYKINE